MGGGVSPFGTRVCGRIGDGGTAVQSLCFPVCEGVRSGLAVEGTFLPSPPSSMAA